MLISKERKVMHNSITSCTSAHNIICVCVCVCMSYPGEALPEPGATASAPAAYFRQGGEETTCQWAGGPSLQRQTVKGADQPAGDNPSQGGSHLHFILVIISQPNDNWCSEASQDSAHQFSLKSRLRTEICTVFLKSFAVTFSYRPLEQNKIWVYKLSLKKERYQSCPVSVCVH